VTFSWSDYLVLAQELADPISVSASTEARLRASISRAYYAAFCSARNHLRDVDGDALAATKTRGVHEYVRRAFKKSPTPARQRIGSDLSRLWRARISADYHDVFPGLESRTTVTLTYGSRVLYNLASLSS